MNQHLGNDHVREMTTYHTPSLPMYQRRRHRRSETLVAMLLIPILVAMTVAMLVFIPLISVA